jgi:hypothetical protein
VLRSLLTISSLKWHFSLFAWNIFRFLVVFFARLKFRPLGLQLDSHDMVTSGAVGLSDVSNDGSHLSPVVEGYLQWFRAI